jgi:hypothetical protein
MGEVERSVTTTIDRELEERGEGSGGHPDLERAFALGVVIAIGIVYLVIRLLFIPRDWPPGWDESVYLSQVTPSVEGVFFNPWHSRGITLIVAPIAGLGGSVADVRLFLMVLSAIAVAAAFGLWVSLVGMAAAVAAFVFSFSWLGLIMASQVEPNFWGAILALAATGLVVRRLEGGRTRDVVLASVLVAATALVRPTEATVLVGAIGVYILICKRRSWRDLVPLGMGLVLGWLPWVVEMSVRFGGLGAALRAAGEGQHFEIVPAADNVLRHLAYMDGNDAHVVIPGAIWWGLLVVMAAVAIRRGLTRPDRTAALLSSLIALALASEYLFFVPALTPRFLLPAYALASVPFGIGLTSLLRGKAVFRVVGLLVLVLLIPWTIWQGAVTARRAPWVNSGSAVPMHVGSTIHRLTEGRPCFVLSQRAYPQIAVTAGCSGAKGGGIEPTAAQLMEFASGGRVVFVVRTRKAPDAWLLSSVEPVPFPTANKTWYVYELPRSMD